MSTTNHNTMPASCDVPVGSSSGKNTTGTMLEGTLAANRTELIQRMLRDALKEPSSVAANLQANGVDLLEMSLVLKTAIMEAVSSSSDVTEVKELQSYIDTYVKLCRQADRVLRLKHEVSNSQHGNS